MGDVCYIDYDEAVKDLFKYTFDYDVEAAVRAAKFVVVRDKSGFYRNSIAIVDNGDSITIKCWRDTWGTHTATIRKNIVMDRVT